MSPYTLCEFCILLSSWMCMTPPTWHPPPTHPTFSLNSFQLKGIWLWLLLTSQHLYIPTCLSPVRSRLMTIHGNKAGGFICGLLWAAAAWKDTLVVVSLSYLLPGREHSRPPGLLPGPCVPHIHVLCVILNNLYFVDLGSSPAMLSSCYGTSRFDQDHQTLGCAVQFHVTWVGPCWMCPPVMTFHPMKLFALYASDMHSWCWQAPAGMAWLVEVAAPKWEL